jgi:hypothetical protein
MNGRERAQLQESMRTRSERLAAGTPVKTNMTTYIDVREKLARGEKVDLRASTEKIGKGEMEPLTTSAQNPCVLRRRQPVERVNDRPVFVRQLERPQTVGVQIVLEYVGDLRHHEVARRHLVFMLTHVVRRE